MAGFEVAPEAIPKVLLPRGGIRPIARRRSRLTSHSLSERTSHEGSASTERRSHTMVAVRPLVPMRRMTQMFDFSSLVPKMGTVPDFGPLQHPSILPPSLFGPSRRLRFPS
jgi:hypothetical protein